MFSFLMSTFIQPVLGRISNKRKPLSNIFSLCYDIRQRKYGVREKRLKTTDNEDNMCKLAYEKIEMMQRKTVLEC